MSAGAPRGHLVNTDRAHSVSEQIQIERLYVHLVTEHSSDSCATPKGYSLVANLSSRSWAVHSLSTPNASRCHHKRPKNPSFHPRCKLRARTGLELSSLAEQMGSLLHGPDRWL